MIAGGTVAAPAAGRSPEAGGMGLWQGLRCVNPLIAIFILLLLMPVTWSFEVGALRVNGYRIVLLFAMIPCILLMVSSSKIRLIPADFLILAAAIWAMLTSIYHLDAAQGAQTGGIFVVESFGAYVLGRVLVTNSRQYIGFVCFLTVAVLAMLLTVIPESVVGINLFGQPPSGMDPRMGFDRARGPMEHPILFGVFTACALGMSWYAIGRPREKVTLPRATRAGAISLTAFTALSSGAITALTVQQLLILYDRITARIAYRWWILLGMFALAYVVIDLLSNRTPIRVFLTYLTFSAHTAYNRLLIWEYGFHHNVVHHPWAGIGIQTEWSRPDWMHSSSVDNFWLVLMLRHGIPCFLLLALGCAFLVWHCWKGAKAKGNMDLFKGWMITMTGLFVGGTTVHFWNALFVFFFLLLGVGGWMTAPAPAPNPRAVYPARGGTAGWTG